MVFDTAINLTIRDNQIYNNSYGVYATNSYNNTFKYNNLINQTTFGFYLQSTSNNNTIINNNATSNWSLSINSVAGFYIGASYNNTLYNNTASMAHGFFLNNSALVNNLTNNTAVNNTAQVST